MCMFRMTLRVDRVVLVYTIAVVWLLPSMNKNTKVLSYEIGVLLERAKGGHIGSQTMQST